MGRVEVNGFMIRSLGTIQKPSQYADFYWK